METDNDSFHVLRILASHTIVSHAEKNPSLCVIRHDVMKAYVGQEEHLFVFGATAPQWARVFSFTRFLDHIQRRTTVGRTPLDE